MNEYEKESLRQASDVNRARREATRVRCLAVKASNPELTISALAERFNTPRRTVEAWLRDKSSTPSS